MSEGVSLLINPTEFFREKVTSAIGNQKLELNEEIEFYLVNLLCEFINPEKINSVLDEDILETPLALILKKALESPQQDEQIKLYKVLGDTSLYVSGYFQDFFNSKTYDIDYYITLGSSAYHNVSSLMRDGCSKGKQFPQIYHSLSHNFPKLVEVLAEVADLLGNSENANLLALYDRWTKNQSERLRKKLEESGIEPIPGNMKVAQ